ncbi:hypothetical protein CRG98_035660 [Punica granatum]|uniref:Retrotransposon gag domain-containing protein n=1 Tax=Punica granatum TaxID=22663 RepID=A0A2I0IJ28_PUNGR|nr:hypothetical protein CRG98_035660 [Punica granatum]
MGTGTRAQEVSTMATALEEQDKAIIELKSSTSNTNNRINQLTEMISGLALQQSRLMQHLQVDLKNLRQVGFVQDYMTEFDALLNKKEMDEKRAKNLCFWCDERFVPGHKCSRRQAFLVEVEAVEEGQEEVTKEELEEIPSPQISLHALLGTRSCQTMRIVGIMGKRLLHILVDSGSTHNFLNEEVGKKLGCQTELMSAVRVAVANGNELKCERVCKKFRWRMQGKELGRAKDYQRRTNGEIASKEGPTGYGAALHSGAGLHQ